jgi:hypothetical protein
MAQNIFNSVLKFTCSKNKGFLGKSCLGEEVACMTSISRKALELLQAKAATGTTVFRDLDIMIPLGLSFPVVSNVIAELEKEGYIDVDRQYVSSRITLI